MNEGQQPVVERLLIFLLSYGLSRFIAINKKTNRLAMQDYICDDVQRLKMISGVSKQMGFDVLSGN